MLSKLNTYRKNITRKTARPVQQEKLVFEIASDLRTIRLIQKFRAEVFGKDFGIQFPDNLDRDMFDFECEHAIVKVAHTDKIVAYTRFYKLPEGQYHRCYSEHEFAIQDALKGKKNIVELGRTCVHPDYRSGKVLGKLWMGMLPHVLGRMNAKYAIGCVSVPTDKSELRAVKAHYMMQQLDPKQVLTGVTSKKPYQPTLQLDSAISERDLPSLFRQYLGMQAKFAKEGYFDEDFKCIDYFCMLEVSEVAKSFIMGRAGRR